MNWENQEKMSNIIYKKMNLFDAPKGSVLVHACNAQGVWGSGIAKQFKEKFPESFEIYKDHCMYHDEPTMFPGLILPEENGYRVGCLITSNNYAARVSEPHVILKHTENGLELFAEKWLDLLKRFPIYSNKFNSGLFKVPWQDTEKILKEFVDKYDLIWSVCDPNLEEEKNGAT